MMALNSPVCPRCGNEKELDRHECDAETAAAIGVVIVIGVILLAAVLTWTS